jgi:hypothetical protein
MRPSGFFGLLILILACVALFITLQGRQRTLGEFDSSAVRDSLVSELGLTDLCLATEARYTRHPAVTDDLAPFMDYPAALEHFPSGLFWAPQ